MFDVVIPLGADAAAAAAEVVVVAAGLMVVAALTVDPTGGAEPVVAAAPELGFVINDSPHPLRNQSKGEVAAISQ